MGWKSYLREARPQFLILSPILIVLGTAMARYEGYVNTTYSLVAMVGLVLLHTSVNVLNDYFDWRSGIDRWTVRTPFSGGSGIIQRGELSPAAVLRMGIIAFLLAVPIGAFFVLVKGNHLLPLFIGGAILVLFYTPAITRIGWGIAEASAGLGLGTLPVLGTFVIINEGYQASAIFASIPSGILVCNLLFLNEFPDMEADRPGGRKTLPLSLGTDKAAHVYSLLTVGVYVWVVMGCVLAVMPLTCLVALLTLPVGLKAIKGAREHRSREELIPALGANVAVVLGTQVLLALGYFMGG